MIKIELPDGSIKEHKKGITGLEIAQSIGERLAMAALAVEIDGEVKDTSFKIEKDVKFSILTFKDLKGQMAAWHSAEHVLTQAMIRLWPKKVEMAMGPAIKEGFYFDFDSDRQFTPEDFEKIEEEMKKIIKEDLSITKEEISVEEARKLFEGNKYKLEWLDEIEGRDNSVTIYKTGDEFADLCKGPHVSSTGKIGVPKLLKLAGAYWRGDSKNKMLQRIYGITFPKQKELNKYIENLKEIEKRDHRKIGKDLGLFSIHEQGPGFPFFLPNGLIIKNELIKFWRELHREKGYQEISTPQILNRSLWETSGHWENYKKNMYTLKIDDEDFAIKPMNCPGGMLVYNETVHSYKELPLRVGELGVVHRHELSGTLTGLFRVRVFTQDDAHHFMIEKQMKSEVQFLMELYDEVYSMFGFDYDIELSTRPEKSIGTDEQWELLTNTLKDVLDKNQTKYKINEGDGAFYGPKIDFHLKDCLGRTWQCGTIQLDMSLPERFDLKYMGEDGSTEHRPVMLHRVVYGSIERFLGILIEHFAGKFPIWLSPVQVRILTLNDNVNDYANKIKKMYFDAGIRAEVDIRAESIPKKVRDAQLQKVPIMLTVGEKEVQNNSVALRTLDGDVKFGVNPDELLEKLKENIKERELNFQF
ncbi:threonine--tRNA ligase [archaeon]|jgi:threonyl-tRNA synthetase|nr:threonine--tRNA ligase [archaeon]MBT4352233.1 threonine--tRNA ligase [archaeon]MBT4648678.1 threonine--tRNA ligase [archaeon]MBT6821802.1 threonine--tRNA ligase [archaeon]